MLDKPLIGEPEPRLRRCLYCNQIFDIEEDQENWDSIDDTGMCLECPIK